MRFRRLGAEEEQSLIRIPSRLLFVGEEGRRQISKSGLP
jgi:hypothetical protein